MSNKKPQRIWRRVLQALAALIGVWLINALAHVVPWISGDARARIALLDYQPVSPRAAGNAYAWLWTLPFAVDDDAALTIAERDSALAIDRVAKGMSIADLTPSVPVGLVADEISDEDKAVLCESWRGAQCLGKIRSKPEVVRSVLERHSALLQRARALAGKGAGRNAMPVTVDIAFPRVGGISSLELSAAALAFIDGNRDTAFNEICHFARLWRQLRNGTDMLILDMVAIAYVTDAAQLYASVLAETPMEAQIPDACRGAFVPLSDSELNQCAEIGAEFSLIGNATEQIAAGSVDGAAVDEPNWFRRVIGRTIDTDWTLAKLAPNYSRWCEPAHVSHRLAREPEVIVQAQTCSTAERMLQPLACVMVVAGQADFVPYYHRLLDLDAHLRLVSIAERIRSESLDPAVALNSLPEELRAPHHAFRYELATRQMVMSNLDTRRSDDWRIPVAVSTPRPE